MNGLICFSILGVMAHDSGLDLEKTVTSGELINVIHTWNSGLDHFAGYRISPNKITFPNNTTPPPEKPLNHDNIMSIC